jgi:hypothetical protein
MAGTLPIALNYQELYGAPTSDPFGSSEEENEDCCQAVYEVWRATNEPLKVDVLLQNIMADFNRPIGCIFGYFADQDSPPGCLRLMHSFKSFSSEPGQSRDWMQAFCSEGDIRGMDITTAGFDENQLAITADVVVPGSSERMLQLLNEEPNHEMVGPYVGTDANVRTTEDLSMVYLPFPLVAGLLGSNIMARQAYELLIPELVNAGMMTVQASGRIPDRGTDASLCRELHTSYGPRARDTCLARLLSAIGASTSFTVTCPAYAPVVWYHQ